MGEEEKLNWVSVIHFLEKEYQEGSLREKEWKYEREVLSRRIQSLEAEIRSNVDVCQGLVNRIKILQIALRQERMGKSGKNVVEEEKLRGLVQRFKLNQQIQKNSHQQFLNQIVKDLKIKQEFFPKSSQREEVTVTFGKEGGDKIFEEKKKFGAHLDVVTNLVHFELGRETILATSSEDCLIKLWNIGKISKEEHPQPIHTLRKHTGPLFALTSCPNPNNSSEAILLSGGIEGDIKSWKVGSSHVDFYKSSPNGSEEEQTIWQLQALEDKLLSVSSDGVVRLLKIEGGQNVTLNYISSFKERQFNQSTVRWVQNDMFLGGCSSAPRIHLWNINGKITSKFIYQIQKNKDPGTAQVNHLGIIKDKKMLLGGCEDGFVRIFDLNSGKIVKKLQVSNAVSTVLGWDWTLVSGDHGGNISTWDSRVFRQIQQKQNVHLCKYDTGLTCMTRLSDKLLTSGADGIVKTFL